MNKKKEMEKKSAKKSMTKMESIRKIVLNNFGLKCLSVIVAVITWMMIINIDDPVKEKTFTVPVQTIHENALKSVNKVFEIEEGATAVVCAKGKKSVIDRLSASDIKATADLSHLSAVDAVDIHPFLKRHFSPEPELICNQVMKISLEERETKQVKVTVIKKGTPASGYSLGECIAKPSMIEVSGGKSAVDRINMVRVFLNVNGAKESFEASLNPIAYDESGKQVKSSTLQYGVSKVKVSAPILRKKVVPVCIDIKGKPAGEYVYSSSECMPERVEIAGKDEYLRNVDSLNVPVDISKCTQSVQNFNIDLRKLFPDLVISDEYATISVRVQFKKTSKRKRTLKLDDIKTYSVADGCEAEIVDERSKVDVVVSSSSAYDHTESYSDVFYVDCKNLEPGIYRLPIRIESDNSSELVKTEKVLVKISTKKNSEYRPGDGPSGNNDEEKPKATETPTPAEPLPTSSSETANPNGKPGEEKSND